MTELSAPSSSASLNSLINTIAQLLAHPGGVLSSGDVAALRRMDPRRIDATGFYKVVATVLEPALSAGEGARAERETRWAAIVSALANLGDLHRPGLRLGHSLVDAGFSELRFARLLRADSERLIDEIPALARFLSAKGVPADFADAARLLLSEGRRDEESIRRRIARDYYGTIHAKNTNS